MQLRVPEVPLVPPHCYQALAKNRLHPASGIIGVDSGAAAPKFRAGSIHPPLAPYSGW